jgi:hypothetical protein
MLIAELQIALDNTAEHHIMSATSIPPAESNIHTIRTSNIFLSTIWHVSQGLDDTRERYFSIKPACTGKPVIDLFPLLRR